MSGKEDYALDAAQSAREVPAPALPYLPRMPKSYRPTLGLIGCGGIASYHLDAYRRLGIETAAFCDIDPARAAERRNVYAPGAAVYEDFRELLARGDIDVVDIATHPAERASIVEAAIAAGKHILSQKPFAIELAVGRRLVDAADAAGARLAVNQNGRWAPHFSYVRHAVAAGLIGEVNTVSLAVHWDHNWIAKTPFNEIPHVLLYDFAIHWFDILGCFLPGRTAEGVYAKVARAATQPARPPLLGSAVVEYSGALASLVFAGATGHGASDRTVITGSKGTLVSQGPDLNHQEVRLYTEAGVARPVLEGTWFTTGFEGTMAELCCAIEEERAPYNDARQNLDSLALAFAAIASAESGQPVAPGSVTKVDPAWLAYG